jgi:nitrite reductase/ring-hydroxylating ferredoxin subunit
VTQTHIAIHEIATASDISDGGFVKFKYEKNGLTQEGFIIRFNGSFYAYKNECVHAPITIDHNGSGVFTEDKKMIMCAEHYALYDPVSGICISGPCVHKRLMSLPIQISDGKIYLIAG